MRPPQPDRKAWLDPDEDEVKETREPDPAPSQVDVEVSHLDYGLNWC